MMTKVRCAIYTRKSSEEGLEQDFNSLDAQYEACAAYIKSQASEGWVLTKERYDDGGLSGGTLTRPGLTRLLSHIDQGQIDIVVVYKVDRLTRSLLDFSKLVEAFDKAGTSFVSVTQSFNTTTSMGRLTLNMLLSFAQFEREVTAERIRDKIAASKARGMWMGGTPPIGYRPDGRSLAVVEEHATIIRHIFGRYSELGNVRLLANELEQEAIYSPPRLTGNGRAFGGKPFSRGQLYKILSNALYIGRIEHGGQSYQGNHDAIIEPALWEQVKATLAANLNGKRVAARSSNQSKLAGLLVDERGIPMVASHACKGKVRYRYYVSRGLQQAGDAAAASGWRIPAREIEQLVRDQASAALANPLKLLTDATQPLPNASDLEGTIARGTAAAQSLRSSNASGVSLLRSLLTEVRLRSTQVTILLDPAALARLLEVTPFDQPVELVVPTTLSRNGMAMKLVMPNGAAVFPNVDLTLVRAIVRGRAWWQELLADSSLTLTKIARREGIESSYVLRIVRLAFLSPQLLDAIVQAKAPAYVSLAALTKPAAIDLRWDRQFGAVSG